MTGQRHLGLLLVLSHFSRVWLCNPIDGSPPGSPVPGILQARTLEWVAISFSNAWKWKAKWSRSVVSWLLATPWTAAYQAPPSMGFSKQEYWSWVPLPSLPVQLVPAKMQSHFTFNLSKCHLFHMLILNMWPVCSITVITMTGSQSSRRRKWVGGDC